VKILQHPALDPWLFGSPLRHPAVAKLVIAGLGFLLLVAVAMSLLTLLGMGRDGALVFARALAASSALSLVPIALLWYLDRRERESPWLFAIAFLWGGVIAAWVAMPLNTIILLQFDQWIGQHPAVKETLGGEAVLLIGAPIAAPLVEETIKGLGIVLLFALLRAEFDNMRDGFIYGALVGAGFNWVEAALYVAQGYQQFGTAPWGMQLGARYALFGLAGHALFSGLFGAMLGLARQTSSAWLRYLAPPAGLVLAIAAHAFNNALPLVVTLIGSANGKPPPQHAEAPPDMGFFEAWTSASLLDLIVFLPFVLLLAFLLYRSGRWEREVIRAELASEAPACVTAVEQRQIERDGAFRTRRIESKHPVASAALVRLQHELAFRKRYVRTRGEDPESDLLVAYWRGEILRVRALVGP
jgi:RsiW-degrading membrane proteinase PrsW (M82 family)